MNLSLLDTMKGKDIFTQSEITKLRELIKLRIKSDPSNQKAIRDKMRKIGFYGYDDWGIKDMKLSDMDSLISSGRIKAVGNSGPIIKPALIPRKSSIAAKSKDSCTSLDGILISLSQNLFDPKLHRTSSLPDAPGNYIVCLRQGVSLPSSKFTPKLSDFMGVKVIYTGIAGGSIRQRDYKTHFNGSAGKSTLRKSLGVLHGYQLIPRDIDPLTGKTKFNEADEAELTRWMHEKLVLFFYRTMDYDNLEKQLIEHFNPPLNLKGCYATDNREFRALLSSLRSSKMRL